MSVLTQRKRPQQQRSQHRVSQILVKAAELFEQNGLEAVTLSDIALSAGFTRSSLYRYFPSKNAVVKALAQLHMDKLKQQFDGVFLSGFTEELPVTDEIQNECQPPVLPGRLIQNSLLSSIDKIIDIYAGFYCHEPGFGAVWGAMASIPELQQLDEQELHYHGRVFYQHTRQLFPEKSERQLRVISTMLPRSVGAILRLAIDAEPEDAKCYIAEGKAMVKAYLLNLSDGD